MIEVNNGPTRILVESCESRVLNGTFYVQFQSGDDKYAFALPLPLAKVFAQSLSTEIAEIEKQTGQKFDGGSIQKNVVSPFVAPKKS
jgi:hypothetical protein